MSNHLQSALTNLNSLVDNRFRCAICFDAFKVPNAIPECLHHFCDGCIKESIRKCGPECPTCRARMISRRDLRKDQLFEDIVSPLTMVICTTSRLVLSYIQHDDYTGTFL